MFNDVGAYKAALTKAALIILNRRICRVHARISVWFLSFVHMTVTRSDLYFMQTGTALANCLLASDCVLIDRHTPAECLKQPLLEGIPTQCKQLRRGFADCKHGMIDMRKRFRGNAPVAADGASYQLYAGRKAVDDSHVAGTDKAETDLVEGNDGEFRAKR